MTATSQTINDPFFVPAGFARTEVALAREAIKPLREIDLSQVGAKGYDEVQIWLRIKDKPEWIEFIHVYEPNPGFLILGTEITVHGRLGDQVGPSAYLIQSNSAQETFESAEYYQRQFRDYASSMQGQVQDTKALADIKLRFENEFKSAMTLRQTYRSNNSGVRLYAKTRAQKDWWGFYTSGGLIDATVRIHQVYVGNPAYLNAVVDKYCAEVTRLAKPVPPVLQTTSVTAIADTYVRADVDTRKNDNYGLERVMNVGTGRGSSLGPAGTAGAMCSLVKFSLGGLSSRIEKAVLELTIHSLGGSTSGPYTVGVYPITQPWQEGNGAEAYRDLVPGATDPDSAAGAAWEASDKNNQAQPSCGPSPVAEATIDPKTVQPGSVVSWDISSVVTQWAKDPTSNHGVMLRDSTTAGQFRQLSFGTREADLFQFPDGVRGPRLVVQHR